MHPSLAAFEIAGPLALRSTADDLAAAEPTLGMAIPPSYQEFAKELGVGLVFPPVGLHLYVPADHPETLTNRSADLVDLIEQCIELDLWEYGPDGDLDLVRRFVPFGASETGLYFAWDPEDEWGDGERWIYTIGSKMLGVFRVAPDPYTFLEACQDDRVKHVLGPGYEAQPAVFRPAVPHR